MTSHPQFAQTPDDVQALRQQAGRWLKALRENAKLSQRELAKAVGFEYYTFISQIESGRGRLPAAQYTAFAGALDVPLRDFVKTLLRYYDPVTFFALFDGEDAAPVDEPWARREDSDVNDLALRLERLEAILRDRS